MKLGFVGTGEIAAAIVEGLCSQGAAQQAIWVSPRSADMASRLAARFAGVSVAASNQQILDECDTIVIAVRPAVARGVLSELKFRPEHLVISLVAAWPLREVKELVAPTTHVARAVPLPSAAERLSPTVIFPPEQMVADLFAKVGSVFEVDREDELNAMSTATATIASYLAFAGSIASWLAEQGIPESRAQEYIARVYLGVTSAAGKSGENLLHLAARHATAGGLNQQFLKHLIEGGVLKHVADGLDAVLRRIQAASSAS
jgi:pyrroline-5-carboxylate reductase